MATNVTQNKMPDFWSSVADDINFEFGFKYKSIASVTNSGGLAKVTLSAYLDLMPLDGEKVFIVSDVYNGIFTVTVTSGLDITINTPFTSNISGTTKLYSIRVPTFSVYKGFEPTDVYNYSSALPFTFVCDLKPTLFFENGVPLLRINLSSICKNIFTITPNSNYNVADTNVFTGIRMLYDTEFTTFSTQHTQVMVLNSSITNAELLELIGVGFYLCPLDKPLIYSSGVTFATYFLAGTTRAVPTIHKFINGVKL